MKSFSKKIFFCAGVLVLAGCWPKKDDTKGEEIFGGTVLIEANGKALLTGEMIDSMLESLSKENQQLEMMLQFMPGNILDQIYDAKKSAAIIGDWAEKEGIRTTVDYIKKQKEIMKAVEESLDKEFFVKKNQPAITDLEVKEYYDKNKETDHRLLKSAAGVKASSIKFDKKEDADKFAKSVTPQTFEKVAKEEKLTVKDLGSVNDSSFNVGTDEKKDILAAKPLSVIITKDDKGNSIVVLIGEKVEAEYYPLEMVGPGLKQMLTQQKTEELTNKKVAEHAEKAGIIEKKDAFEGLKKKYEDAAKKKSADLDPQQAEETTAGKGIEPETTKTSKELADVQKVA